MSSLTLSYSLILPQSVYPHLNYLILINKRLIKNCVPTFWNNENYLANILEKSPLFVLNLKRMIVPNKIERLLNKEVNKISFKTKNEKKDLKLILPKAPIIKKEVLSASVNIEKRAIKIAKKIKEKIASTFFRSLLLILPLARLRAYSCLVELKN